MAGCDYPPDWSEVHHTVRWEDGGTTDLDQLVLLCGYHHDHHQAQGWQIFLREGHAFCTPPPWIDPERTPIRNRMHDTQPAA